LALVIDGGIAGKNEVQALRDVVDMLIEETVHGR